MSEKTSAEIPLSPSVCSECGGPLSFAHYICKTCKTVFCAGCREKHVKEKHNKHYPTLTAMGCVECGGPPDGTCWFQNPPCPAPLCHNWECKEKHEARHYGDKDKGKPH